MQYINKDLLIEMKNDKYYSKYVHLCDDIINKSYYVTKDKIIQGTIDFVSSLNLNGTKLYILLDSRKIGSQHWLYYHYHKFIRGHTIITDKTCIDEDNATILVIDDVIIGGGFISNLLHDFILIQPKKTNMHVIIYSYAKNKHVNITSQRITWCDNFSDAGYTYDTYSSIELDYYKSDDPLYKEYTSLVQGWNGLNYIPIFSDYTRFDSPCNLTLLNNIRDKPDREFMQEIKSYFENMNIL